MHFGILRRPKGLHGRYITFGRQPGRHRQCGPEICTFHLGFSLVYESINQKVQGVRDTPRGSVGPCEACGLSELAAAVFPGCGAEAGAADDSSAWPEWYKELVGRVESEILPAWESLHDDQQLAGWSDAVMVEAAERYARNYASKQVTSPSTLFRKIAAGVKSEQRPSSGGGSGSRSSGRRAGGSGIPGDAGRR